MHLVQLARVPLSLIACLGVLAGCATARMSGEWRDSSFAALPAGSRVIASCPVRDETVRRMCEDQWAVRIGAAGHAAVPAYSLRGLPSDGPPSTVDLRNAARTAGASAVISTHLSTSGIAVVDSGPQVGIGVGGGSGGHRGGFSFGGVGISIPIGGTRASQGMDSSTSLLDVASGQVVWSGSARTAASDDLEAQLTALTGVTAEAMKKAGLL